MEPIKIMIPGNPITKKNHQQIFKNRRTGKPFITQSEVYKRYERDCGWFLNGYEMITDPVNVCCIYYMETRRRVDLPNLQNATCDILVKHKILGDDNYKIVHSQDGSRVRFDKENPRVEIEITETED